MCMWVEMHMMWKRCSVLCRMFERGFVCLFVCLCICLFVCLLCLHRRQDRFYERKSKPKSASSILQALSCQFFGLKLSSASKLVISKKIEIKDRFTCIQCLRAFFR